MSDVGSSPPPSPDDKPPRLSEQVPIGVLFVAAAGAVLLFLALVGVLAFFALRTP